MSTRPGVSEGKYEFLEQMLRQDSSINLEEVNQAWKSSGHEGTISQSYLGKVKAELGLTRPRGKSEADKGRGREPASEPAPKRRRPDQQPAESRGARAGAERSTAASASTAADEGEAEDRDRALEELEAELDRLLFQVMEMGGLEEVVQELRRVRRLISRTIQA